MANNRMWLACARCLSAAKNPDAFRSATFMLSKYYPSSGWYAWARGTRAFDTWMDEHRHEDDNNLMWGPTHFKLIFEQNYEEGGDH